MATSGRTHVLRENAVRPEIFRIPARTIGRARRFFAKVIGSVTLTENCSECGPLGGEDAHRHAQHASWRTEAVLPLAAHEREFLERLNGAGDIAPELLTAEPEMQAILRDHPGLRWKALNVKKRLGRRHHERGEPRR